MWIAQRNLARNNLGKRLVIKGGKVLAHGTRVDFRTVPIAMLADLNAVLVACIRRDQAGINSESFALDQSRSHAVPNNFIK